METEWGVGLPTTISVPNNDGNSTPPLSDGQTEYIATHVVVSSGSGPWSQSQTILRYPHSCQLDLL